MEESTQTYTVQPGYPSAMLKLHTVYVIALVSQATSASVLAMLAWADRRSRWLMPLATACALHAAAIYLMPLWRGTGRWVPQAFSAAVLVAMLYLIRLGLQSLLFPVQRRSARVHAVIGGLMLLLFALASYNSLWCIEASEMAAISLLAWTVRMLWNAHVLAVRGPLRVTALLLSAILVLFLVRMPLELLVPPPPFLLLLRESTMLLVTSMAFSFLAIYAVESRRRLHEESRQDVLTGLLNRRAMEEAAGQQLQSAARHKRPCALLMVDLDHFKELNDTWGHDLGDRALIAAGRLLLRIARDNKNCEVARMGGEEFALLLSNASVDVAHAVAWRLCAEVAALRISVGETEVRFTASVGVSALRAGETSWLHMLRRADVALYGAKREGRNRVTLCTEAVAKGLRQDWGAGTPLAPSLIQAVHPPTSGSAAGARITEIAK